MFWSRVRFACPHSTLFDCVTTFFHSHPLRITHHNVDIMHQIQVILEIAVPDPNSPLHLFTPHQPLPAQHTLPHPRGPQQIAAHVDRVPARRELAHAEPSEQARRAVAIAHKDVARVERAAEDPRGHRAAEVRREVELRHHIVAHPHRLLRGDDLEAGEREAVRLHEMGRRVNVVRASGERDVRKRERVLDVRRGAAHVE